MINGKRERFGRRRVVEDADPYVSLAEFARQGK